MDKIAKMEFVVDFMSSIQKEVLQNIASGRIPAEWDGHQLREYLADKFAWERTELMKRPRSRMRREYKNAVLVRNL